MLCQSTDRRSQKGCGSRVELFGQIRRDHEFRRVLSKHALARPQGRSASADGAAGAWVAGAAGAEAAGGAVRRRSWASFAS